MIFALIGVLLIYGVVDFFYHLRNNLAEKQRLLRQQQLDKQMEIKRIWEEKQTLERIKREKHDEIRRIRSIRPLLKPRMNLLHSGYEDLGIVTVFTIGQETITCGSKNGLVKFPVSSLGKYLNITRDQGIYNDIHFSEPADGEIPIITEPITTNKRKSQLF